jgi:integrase
MTKINQLTPAKVRHAKAGRYADGGNNLYLEVSKVSKVSKGGGRSYIFLWKRGDRRRAMGLGSATKVSLAVARDLAKQANEAVARGIDPIEARRQRRATAITFAQAAEKCHDDIKGSWRSGKYSDQWLGQLLAHGKRLANRNVSEITPHDVVGVLRPLWDDQPDLALRVRERIERVLGWCRAHGYRGEGENPARWKGGLKDLMPTLKRKRERVTHMAALPYDDIPAFMAKLRDTDDSLHRARILEFTILTAARSNEVYGAQWDEIDFKQKVWTVPKERMKAGVPHIVPLSDRALAILKGSARRPVLVIRFPRLSRQPANVEHADADPADTVGCQGHRARVSLDLPRLGWRPDKVLTRRHRNGAGTCRRRCH